MKKEQDHFAVLRIIQRKPGFSQRKLAGVLGFSLGKLNYCLKVLQDKGLVKIRSFQKKKNQFSNMNYVLTSKGTSEKTRLTTNFMKRKMEEYDELKSELKMDQLMWAVFKYKQNNYELVKSNLIKKVNKKIFFFNPKISFVKKSIKNLIDQDSKT